MQLKVPCVQKDALLIYDEIQGGFGRTGALWAHCALPKEEHPDIVTMIKPLGKGLPLNPTMISEKMKATLAVSDHGITYGGNPLRVAVGSYVLDQVSNAAFLVRESASTYFFVRSLELIAQANPVKGRGLLLGLQLRQVVDAEAVVDTCHAHRLIVITAGGNVICLVPALNIPEEAILLGGGFEYFGTGRSPDVAVRPFKAPFAADR